MATTSQLISRTISFFRSFLFRLRCCLCSVRVGPRLIMFPAENSLQWITMDHTWNYCTPWRSRNFIITGLLQGEPIWVQANKKKIKLTFIWRLKWLWWTFSYIFIWRNLSKLAFVKNEIWQKRNLANIFQQILATKVDHFFTLILFVLFHVILCEGMI